MAVLDRNRGKRKFKRITAAALTDLLPASDTSADEGQAADPGDPEPESSD